MTVERREVCTGSESMKFGAFDLDGELDENAFLDVDENTRLNAARPS